MARTFEGMDDLLTGSFAVAVAMLWLMLPARELMDPNYLAWLNRQLESEGRATAISMSSQAHALGEILGGPAAGLLATVFSVRAAIVVSGLILTPSLLLCALGLRQEGAAADALLEGQPAVAPGKP